MSHDQLAGAAPGLGAVDRQHALDGSQVEVTPVARLRRQHAPRIEEVVGDHRPGVEAAVIGVARIDQLERRDAVAR
ncbi:MAG: hypothetical protein MJE12_29360, partial [Alphaproteobacteria bacterium]|nr:hypothetical protein [Alphaproteobacteria bacterium]